MDPEVFSMLPQAVRLVTRAARAMQAIIRVKRFFTIITFLSSFHSVFLILTLVYALP